MVCSRLHNQPHIVHPASNEHERPFLTGYAQLHLHSLWSWRKVRSALSSLRATATVSLRTIFVSSWPRLARPTASGTFVRQTGFGTSRWSSLLQNAPQLMEWDTTVTTWPRKAPLNSPAVLPCVAYGSKDHLSVLYFLQTFKKAL